MGAYEVYLKNSRIPKLYQNDIKLKNQGSIK